MNKTLPALPGKAAALPGAFEIGYTAHDGAQHRVPLAEAAMVRFADTQPTRRIRTRKGGAMDRHWPTPAEGNVQAKLGSWEKQKGDLWPYPAGRLEGPSPLGG